MKDEISVEVLVVPVAGCFKSLEPPAWLDGVVRSKIPAILAFTDGGSWFRQPARPGMLPRDTAQLLAQEASTRILVQGLPEPVQIRSCGFIEPASPGEALRLVYTAAWPVSLPEVPTDTGAWVNLATGDGARFEAEVLDVVRDHWRQALEETPRVTELLPKYFTMSQMHELYEALWGKLDWGSFKDFAVGKTRNNTSIAVKVDERESIKAERDETLSRLTGQDAGSLVGGGFGVSAAALAVPIGFVAASVAAATAVVAGTTAYQRSTKGRAPDWYRASRHPPQYLTHVFAARPTWLKTSKRDRGPAAGRGTPPSRSPGNVRG